MDWPVASIICVAIISFVALVHIVSDYVSEAIIHHRYSK